MSPRIFRIFLVALLLPIAPQFAVAQTVSVSSATTSGKPKPKPKPTPKPTPTPTPPIGSGLGGDPNYTRTISNGSATADQWSAGTNWDAVPTSGTTTQLVFGGSVPASLAAGVTIFTNNNIAGNFQLNIFDFTYAGPASGTQPTVTVSGNPLQFVSNGATTPTMNLNGGGAVKPLLTVSNNIVLTNTLTVTANSNGILSGVISGAGGLTKLGGGELDLGSGGSSDNTYTGLTTATAGTLGLGKGGTTNAFGGDLLINGGSVIYSNGTNNQIPDSAKVTISSGSLAIGGRTETIGSVSTPASGLAMNGGALSIASSGSLRIFNSFSVSGGVISFTGGDLEADAELNFSGGQIDFATSGNPTLTLKAGTGSGVTYSASGTSTAQITSSGGGGKVVLNSGATTVFNIADSPSVATEMVISATVDGTNTANLQKSGAGVLVISGAGTYGGTTAISAGTLEFGKQVSLYNNLTGQWTAANIIVSSGATAAFNVGGTGEFTSANIDTLKALGTATGGFKSGSFLGLDTTNASGGTFTYNSNISNPSAGTNALGLVKLGSGTLILGGNSSYSGGTTANDGLLQLNSTTALGSTSGSLTVNAASGNAAILDLNGNSISVGNLTGTGGNIWNNGPTAGSSTVTLTIGTGNTGGGNYQGVISNNNGAAPLAKVALTKTGSGTITLSGTNTYTGATLISGGTLLVNGSTAAGSAVTVNSSGTLGGSGTVGGTVDVKSGGNLSPGSSPGILHTGALTLESGANYLVDLNNTTAGSGYDQTVVTGTVDLGGVLASNLVLNIGGTLSVGQKFFIVLNDGTDLVSGTFAQGATVTSGADTFTINYADNGDGGNPLFANDISLTVTAVPEPSTWVGGSLALAALLFTQRRRFAKRTS